MRSLLARGQAHRRQEVAPRLGVPRHTVGRWRVLDTAGGRQAFRATRNVPRPRHPTTARSDARMSGDRS
jgi:hypothetical protein